MDCTAKYRSRPSPILFGSSNRCAAEGTRASAVSRTARSRNAVIGTPSLRILGAAWPRLPSRSSAVVDRQLRPGIGDEHGQQARGLGGAGILAGEVVRAGRLEPALFCAADARLAALDLRADAARQHVGEDGGRGV